jgi:hypothetical protein
MSHEHDNQKQMNSENDFDEFDYLIVRESYCMACDGPLKSYQRLICHECLSQGVDVLKNLVDNLDQDSEKKYIFIDLDFQPSSEEDSLLEEIIEDED